ncbi:MAG: DNA topoisomerase IV subunit A [Candidatus Altiarchaeales archaeon]|nr:DNA topoisomerase IV subunit A [Candidatus Altiarchaeota archaeon]MBU4342353.1 DNA topoisomerase IV subunit A [Candidatus Altiarchaeota archaeon]MBU4407027.1 DNA topoisomerase IV subunit A [Candidatus Altiarchaeota archaeon]MBU4437087.1 DNA topoisomerase IV subunit A [Candidatus Altiarchaeota archaeon]MCG2783027.1 DNA topoisomerase IV subunit A [Candidatus Altiarchaeales archaeon]
MEREQVIKKINGLGKSIMKNIDDMESPNVSIPQRNINNITFNKSKNLLELGDKKSTRSFMNVAHSKRFMQTVLIAGKCRELVERDKTASIRELYYQLKHTIADSKENTFEDQSESDPLVVDLETMLGTLREELHLKADDKGTLIGNIVIEDSGDFIDCSKLGRSGLSVPSIVEHYKFQDVNADYVLVIETGAMFDRLVEEKYPQKNNCIMVSTKGQAARGCRRLVHRLNHDLGLPAIMFSDGDPWGYYIYSVMKAGSMALAHESRRLGTPQMKFVGMTMDDIDTYDLKKVTENLKDLDKKRISELLRYPWFQKKEWVKQLNLMSEKGVRIEQQALASKSLEFVAEEYLPQKIEKGQLLP